MSDSIVLLKTLTRRNSHLPGVKFEEHTGKMFLSNNTDEIDAVKRISKSRKLF